MLRRVLILAFGAGLLACKHTEQAQQPAATPAPGASQWKQRMNAQWEAYRSALTPAPSGKRAEKDRQGRAVTRASVLNSPFQDKRFETFDYSKRYYDARTLDSLKMFPTRQAETRFSEYRDRGYPTPKITQPMVERRNYPTRTSAAQEKEYATKKKYGLRDLSPWQGREVASRREPATKLISRTAVEPTKATQVVDPKKILGRTVTLDFAPEEAGATPKK